MAVIKNEFPILEYSTDRGAVIEPFNAAVNLPSLCLITFFGEVLDDFVKKYSGEQIASYESEMRTFEIYRVTYQGVPLCVTQASVGGGSIAMQVDHLYGRGVQTLLCCGSCGVLADIPGGDVILPVRALRDEGASYKYLAPSRFVELEPFVTEMIAATLEEKRVPYIKCTTWTTDGFYRECSDMVEHRISEGCTTVEMECATMTAIAKFREKHFGQLLYSGDILVCGGDYDDRDWYNNLPAREALFYLTLDALIKFSDNTSGNK